MYLEKAPLPVLFEQFFNTLGDKDHYIFVADLEILQDFPGRNRIFMRLCRIEKYFRFSPGGRLV